MKVMLDSDFCYDADLNQKKVYEATRLHSYYKVEIGDGWIEVPDMFCTEVSDLTFDKAYQLILNGFKVRRKGWDGYWFRKGEMIYLKFKNFRGEHYDKMQCIEIVDSTHIITTLEHTTYSDWEVVPNEENEKEENYMKRYYLEIGSFLVKDDSVFPPGLTDMPEEAQVFTGETKRGDTEAQYGGKYREIFVGKALETVEDVITKDNLYQIVKEDKLWYYIHQDDGSFDGVKKDCFKLIDGVEYDAFFDGETPIDSMEEETNTDVVELKVDFDSKEMMNILESMFGIMHLTLIAKLDDRNFLVGSKKGTLLLNRNKEYEWKLKELETEKEESLTK